MSFNKTPVARYSQGELMKIRIKIQIVEANISHRQEEGCVGIYLQRPRCNKSDILSPFGL